MSIVNKKSKFLELDGVRVVYRAKDDSIQITSSDEDLKGEPFNITLKQGTPSEASLRKLLIKQGLINPELLTFEKLPKIAAHPMLKEKNDNAWSNIPIGIKKDGTPVLWRTASESNILVTGRTGGGKSIIQRNIINHCVMHNDKWKFIGLDILRVELYPYKKYPNTIREISSSFEDCINSIHNILDIVKARYAHMEEAEVNNISDVLEPETNKPYHSIMVMIDETNYIFGLTGSNTEEEARHNKLRIDAYNSLVEISRLGRAAGVHLSLSMHRPDVTLFKGELKEHLQFRVSAGRIDPTPSAIVFGSHKASEISSQKGRGYAQVIRHGEGEEFQIYFADYEALDRYLLDNPTVEPERYQQLIANK